MDALAFSEKYKPGDDFTFGSNVYGCWNKDGSIFVNSHNEEQLYFSYAINFIRYWFEDDESVLHEVQFPIGERDEDGAITWTVAQGSARDPDPDEQGSTVWSKMRRVGHNCEEPKQCPKCLSRNISADDIDPDYQSRVAYCQDCQCRWSESFTFDRWGSL